MTNKYKNYYIFTWGCAMNTADGERVATFYENRGWKKTNDYKQADEIILITCSVRKSAEDRVLGLVKNIADEFDQHPEKFKNETKPKIILSGCMLHHGEKRLNELSDYFDEISEISHITFDIKPKRLNKKHALVPISTGCNSFCTYCVVPLARGREKSRPESEIIEEIKYLCENGYKEITLLGQNVNSYGLEKIGIGMRKILDHKKTIPSNQSQYRKFQGKPPFVKLLEKVCAMPEIKKVHFMSSNPWDFYEELIELIAENPKIDRQIHLPLQSGDNEILAKMNRGYTRQQYLELVKKIKEKIPEVVLTTDIIVGFPGETDKQFENTVDLCRKVGFKIAYIGKYSTRPGTVSNKMYEDNVPIAEKKRRWKILEELVNKPNL